MLKFKEKRKLIPLRSFFKKMGILMGNNGIPLNTKQKKMVSLVKRFINNPKSELTVDPILGNCYAECNGYFIILTQRNIDVYGGTDGNGDYTEINHITGDKLINSFYNKVSERRIEKENVYKNAGLSKLDTIFDNIKNSYEK